MDGIIAQELISFLKNILFKSSPIMRDPSVLPNPFLAEISNEYKLSCIFENSFKGYFISLLPPQFVET